MGDTWTAADIPDQRGRVAVVTGANSGLGFETARALAAAGATVIMACRRVDAGERAADRIRGAVDTADVSVRELDLASLASVESFAEGLRTGDDALHLLVNNAGVMHLPYRRTDDGFEMQFGVNHLGHFALTGHLFDRLVGATGARVVTVSSGLHRRGRIDFTALRGADEYDRYEAYAASKLANLLFMDELARRIDDAGVEVESVAAHPGWAATNLQFAGAEMEDSRARRLVSEALNALFAQDAETGTLPQLYAATATAVDNGDFVGPAGFMELRGPPTLVEPADRARDRRTAERLWTVSESMTGVTFDVKE